MGLLFHSLWCDRKRVYMTLEKRKRWIVVFLDKAQRELQEGQKQGIWWESFCLCFWGERGAFKGFDCSLIFRIASLKYRTDACEEFCQKSIPFLYEKCLSKAVVYVIVLPKFHEFPIFKAETHVQEFSCTLRWTISFCRYTCGCSWEALVFWGCLRLHKKPQGNTWTYMHLCLKMNSAINLASYTWLFWK